jgi:hypothetical protein
MAIAHQSTRKAASGRYFRGVEHCGSADSTRGFGANLSKYGRCLQKLIGKRLRFVMIYDKKHYSTVNRKMLRGSMVRSET